MKAYKKALALFLALGLSLSLASCSQIQSAIGSITGKEDPSVAGNKPAGNHDDEDTWTPPSSSIPAPAKKEIDDTVDPIELYGVTVQKYKNCDYTVVNLGGGVHSDIREITMFDENGNELMPFPTGRPFREVARSFLDEERIARCESPQRYPVGTSQAISLNLDTGFPMIAFYNMPESKVSLLDLEFESIEGLWGDGAKIMADSLGKPTAAYVSWRPRGPEINYVWVCNGFYAETYVPAYTGDYYTTESISLYLDSLDKDRLSNWLRPVLSELGLK